MWWTRTLLFFSLSSNAAFFSEMLLSFWSSAAKRPSTCSKWLGSSNPRRLFNTDMAAVTFLVFVSTLNTDWKYVKKGSQITGKSMSEALIFASTNPQYDNRLFIELPLLYMTIPSSEHAWGEHEENMLCRQIDFCFDIQNNLCKQHVLPMFWAWNFHVLNW